MIKRTVEEQIAARRNRLDLAWMVVVARAAQRRKRLIEAAMSAAWMNEQVARASGRSSCRDALHNG